MSESLEISAMAVKIRVQQQRPVGNLLYLGVISFVPEKVRPRKGSKRFRLLGSLERPRFADLFSTVLGPAIEFGGAQLVRGLLEAKAKTTKWWP